MPLWNEKFSSGHAEIHSSEGGSETAGRTVRKYRVSGRNSSENRKFKKTADNDFTVINTSQKETAMKVKPILTGTAIDKALPPSLVTDSPVLVILNKTKKKFQTNIQYK
jgi:hypothetical protein